MRTHLTFTRKNAYNIENLVVVKFSHKVSLNTPYLVFKAFTKGITNWVENTHEGKNLWKYTCEDLNIGDILDQHNNKELSEFLSVEGIKKWKPLYELVDQEEFSYDKVLASPN